MKKILILLICLSSVSCEDSFDAALQTESTDLLVVEGLLTNEKISHKITLSRPHREINGDPLPASGAVINIIEASPNEGEIVPDTVFLLTESPPGSGEYLSDPFRAVFGRFYVLTIDYEGNSYSAFDSSEPGEPLCQIKPIPASEDLPVYTLDFQTIGNNANYITYDFSWENTSFCQPDTLCTGKVVFYDLKTIDVHDIFKPEKTDFFFPMNTTIIRRKYSVSDRYKNYLRSLLSETEWRGGLFDIQRANASTNLSEGAIGYFAVSTVVSDTTIISE